MRDEYEILLLEARQGLKEAESKLLNLACIDIRKFRELRRLRAIVQHELVNYRSGSKKSLDVIRLIGG